MAQGREGLQSPIVKFIPDESLDLILERTGAKDGDLIFFGADKAKVVNEAIYAALTLHLRQHIPIMAISSSTGVSRSSIYKIKDEIENVTIPRPIKIKHIVNTLPSKLKA
mgnify:CR=1 FL=1